MSVALAVKKWTLRELHSLPDDGNKYELIAGELFVTPPPSPNHEDILARLTRILDTYVVAHGLGFIYHPRSVVQWKGSEVEPDLMVRQPQPRGRRSWARAPLPVLVVEVLSPYTWRRDQEQKRALYQKARIEEYWIVDPEERTITSARAGRADVIASGEMRWWPSDASAPLDFDVRDLFPRD